MTNENNASERGYSKGFEVTKPVKKSIFTKEESLLLQDNYDFSANPLFNLLISKINDKKQLYINTLITIDKESLAYNQGAIYALDRVMELIQGFKPKQEE